MRPRSHGGISETAGAISGDMPGENAALRRASDSAMSRLMSGFIGGMVAARAREAGAEEVLKKASFRARSSREPRARASRVSLTGQGR